MSLRHTDFAVYSTPLNSHFYVFPDSVVLSPPLPSASKPQQSEPQTPEQFRMALAAYRQQHPDEPSRAKVKLFGSQESGESSVLNVPSREGSGSTSQAEAKML